MISSLSTTATPTRGDGDQCEDVSPVPALLTDRQPGSRPHKGHYQEQRPVLFAKPVVALESLAMPLLPNAGARSHSMPATLNAALCTLLSDLRAQVSHMGPRLESLFRSSSQRCVITFPQGRVAL